jgi:predicted ATPase
MKPTSWRVITGAPCAGKTTVLAALTSYGFRFIPEVARVYIDRQLAMGRSLEDIRRDEGEFQRGLVSTKMQIEAELPPEEVVFLDRAMPDSITYFRVAGLDPTEVITACQSFRYSQVFIFDRLPLQQDGRRTEDDSTAEYLDRHLEADYQALGYKLIRVPVMTVDKRVAFVLNQMSCVK